MKNSCGGCLLIFIVISIAMKQCGDDDLYVPTNPNTQEVNQERTEFAKQYAPELAEALENIISEMKRRNALQQEYGQAIRGLRRDPNKDPVFVKRQEDLRKLGAEHANLSRALDELYLTSKALETDPNAMDNQADRAKSIAAAKDAALNAQRLLRSVMAESQINSINGK